MAHASPKTRQIRRLKRERTLALRLAQAALNERDQARTFANAIIQKMGEAYEKENAPKKKDYEITYIKEDNEQDHQANRPDTDSSGLEVPKE